MLPSAGCFGSLVPDLKKDRLTPEKQMPAILQQLLL
jgi:hypothetical protein